MNNKESIMKYYRDRSIMLYLRWFNDYLTIATFAEHHEITEHQAKRLINVGREKYSRYVRKI